MDTGNEPYKVNTEEARLAPPEEENKGELQIQMVSESPRVGCDCNQVLLVDDNETNIHVLQSYLGSVQVVADEVMHSTQGVGKKRGRGGREDYAQSSQSLLRQIQVGRHGSQYAGHGWTGSYPNCE